MKKCTYCGKEYTDDFTACQLDGESLEYIRGSRVQGDPKSNAGPGTPETFDPDAELRRQAANNDIKVGGLFFGGGLLVTFLTMSAASSSPTGGSYILAWGPILFGGHRLLRGLMAR